MGGLPLGGGAFTGSASGGWSLREDGIGRAIRSLTAWKASGVEGTIRCMGPLPLPGVRGVSRTSLKALSREASPCSPVRGRWSKLGPLPATPFPSFYEASECPWSVSCFLWCFCSTSHGEQCREETSGGGALLSEAEVLGAESGQEGSEAHLKAASNRRALR